jgi:hypothetical protein
MQFQIILLISFLLFTSSLDAQKKLTKKPNGMSKDEWNFTNIFKNNAILILSMTW